MFHEIVLDDNRLQGLAINRVALSKDKGLINIYFYAFGGEKEFQEKFSILVLYKPSLRKAIAQKIPARYTPEISFKFDELFEKQKKVEDIFEKIKSEPKGEQ